MYFKYPRTSHLPWSQGVQNDDKIIDSLDGFLGKEIIITEKMDGENTSIYRDHIHARSIDSRNHYTRNWVKEFWAKRQQDIPEGWRVCGENLFAKHSIRYEGLPAYFMGFSVWNDKNVCLSWDETLEWFALLDVTPVNTIHRGIFDSFDVKQYHRNKEWITTEGYVIRRTSEIPYEEFGTQVAKFVRKGHVQTDKHWMYDQKIEKNGIREYDKICT